jgi:chitinase
MSTSSIQKALFTLLPLGALFWFFPNNMASPTPSTKPKKIAIIAYYAGNGQNLEQYKWEQLSHFIFSFCHLRGQDLVVDNARDSLTIRKLVALKKQHKQLKVMLSLGGWGGCAPCSAVFNTAAGRKEFARSVQALCQEYDTDGIDLDWEYPGIEGYPGHQYLPEDKTNFTLLVQELRQILGKKAILSFAAGGFKRFFDQSCEWDKVMPLVNYVNLMSYDLVSGYSTVTGHHTPMFSTPQQEASTQHGVNYLLELGVPPHKIVIGAAFYARSWENVANINRGLFQSGKFKSFVSQRNMEKAFPASEGFVFYRDSLAQAPYAYSPQRKEFATFDDSISVQLKTRYARQQNLGGIMFWQLTDDRVGRGLLQAIWEARE